MTDEVPQPAVEGPVYFLSYAHADPPPGTPFADLRGDDQDVWKFHNELSDHVRRLVGCYRTGTEPGFLDRTIRSGQQWSPRIRDAVRTVPVLVALLSADYVKSEWRALEWNAFSLREPIRRDGHVELGASTLVPVWWSPVNGRLRPGAIADVHYYLPSAQDNAALRRRYVNHGVYGLVAQHRWADYHALIWHFARHIPDLHQTYEVPVGLDLPEAELQETFGKGAGR